MGIIVCGVIILIFIYTTMRKVGKHPYLIQLGENIRAFRKSKGFTQESLAFEAEIDRSYMGGIKRGERNISFYNLVNIASCLGRNTVRFTKAVLNNR